MMRVNADRIFVLTGKFTKLDLEPSSIQCQFLYAVMLKMLIDQNKKYAIEDRASQGSSLCFLSWYISSLVSLHLLLADFQQIKHCIPIVLLKNPFCSLFHLSPTFTTERKNMWWFFAIILSCVSKVRHLSPNFDFFFVRMIKL